MRLITNETDPDASGANGDIARADSDTVGPRGRPPRRRWRRFLGALLVFAAGLIAGALMFGSSAPIGYFRSADGQTAYMDAYERALAQGPPVSQRLMLETAYGDVRVLRYDAADPADADADPLVLLPGTQSGAPMWVANIPTLRAGRPVYVVDLLGQPGTSIQSRPIETHEDEARWLAQVIEQLPGDPTVMGHSLGAGWRSTSRCTSPMRLHGSSCSTRC